jgi:hypothetical protein
MKLHTRNTSLVLAKLFSVIFILAASIVVSPHRAMAQDELPYTKKPEDPPQPTGSVIPFPNSVASCFWAPFPFVAIIRPPKLSPMKLNLPGTFIAGEDFTGSLGSDSFPGIGRTGGSILPGIILATENKRLALKDGHFTVKLNDGPVTKLQVLDEKGHTLTGFELHTGPNPKPLDNFFVPSSGAYGSTMNVWVPKANIGDPLRPDYMKILIGGREMPNLAASSVNMLTRIDYDTPRPTEIEINVGPFTFKKSFRVLKLDLSADSLNLQKGEWTTVHIVVGGLQNLRAPAHMKIVVTGAVSMSGAGEVEIQPADVSASGTYTTTRRLDAGEAGTFGVNVTVTVDKEP